MLTILQNFSWLSAFACLLLGAHLLRLHSNNAVPSILLGAVFVVMGLQSILMGVILAHGRGVWAVFLPSLALSLGPLLLMYFESLAENEYRVTWMRGLHFVPVIFCFFQMVSGLFWMDPDLMIVLSFAVYSIALLWRVKKGRRQFSHIGSFQSTVFLWLVSCFIALALSLLNEILILVELHRGTPISSSSALLVGFLGKLVMVSFTLFSALKNPSPFTWLEHLGKTRRRPEQQSQQASMYRDLVERFDHLVVKQKLYAEEAVSLKSVAGLLAVPQRTLSEAINYVRGESFSKTMNRLRVKQAKSMLMENADKSIAEIMLDSGFRTKSNFNKEFLAIEGVSPSEFRVSIKH